MVWCLLAPAVALAALAAVALTFDPRTLRLPRLSPRRALRGCLAGTLVLLAGVFAAAAAALAHWTP